MPAPILLKANTCAQVKASYSIGVADPIIEVAQAGTPTIAHYRLMRPLGEGGMGEVFLAEDTELERLVAIKVMSAELSKDPNQRMRFRSEAKAASGLAHPNICVIHEVGETDDGRPFLAMEYIEGRTLDVIMRHRRLALRETISLGRQVAEALEAAHTRGIAHRDIKPGNIMLDRQGRAKVLDFGLAKRFALNGPGDSSAALSHTQTGVLIGTPYYMSPEQALGRDLDNRTDIFSLGVVLYEMAVGQRPFLGRTVGETINNVVNQKPQPLELEDTTFSPGFDNIVFKCLQKDPVSRYSSARILAEDLGLVENGLPHSARSGLTTPTPAPRTEIIAQDRNGFVAGDSEFNRHTSKDAGAEGARRTALHLSVMVALVAVVILLAAGLFYVLHSPTAARHLAHRNSSANGPQNSVAVLPFDNFSGSNEPDTDYLSDGLTEEITSALSRISGLKVAARNSAFTFKGKKADPHIVGTSLHVNTLLSGSVRKAGKQVRVIASLINVTDGVQLWSETYDRSLDDIIAVEEDIARRIAQKLQGAGGDAAVPSKTTDPEAYMLYQQARQFWNQRTEAGLNRAILLFQQALARDPGYAAAHAGLAASYSVLPGYSAAAMQKDYGPLAVAEARRALELDSNCAEAHAVLGNQQLVARDFKSAEDHFKQAIRLDPNYPTAHHWYARYLGFSGRTQEAMSEARIAMELDPFSKIIRTLIPEGYCLMGDYDRGLEESKKVVEAFPDFPVARTVLIQAHLLKGQYEEALVEIEKARALQPDEPTSQLMYRGYALGRLGRKEEAEKVLAVINDQAKMGRPGYGHAAYVYLGLKDYDKAIEALEREEASDGLDSEIAADPFFSELRGLPRFQALLKKAKLIE